MDECVACKNQFPPLNAILFLRIKQTGAQRGASDSRPWIQLGSIRERWHSITADFVGVERTRETRECTVCAIKWVGLSASSALFDSASDLSLDSLALSVKIFVLSTESSSTRLFNWQSINQVNGTAERWLVNGLCLTANRDLLIARRLPGQYLRIIKLFSHF